MMKLEKGNIIGITALAGPCERGLIDCAVSHLNGLGYRVELAENIYDEENYLAGSDERKLAGLYKLLAKDDVKLILNARGGYGSIRLINKIDYEIFKKYTKPFVGYSDITALLLMIYKKTGLITYHGPMACSDFGEGVNTYTFDCLRNALTGRELCYKGDKTYVEGVAEGIIWGGNLATVVSLCGQDFVPNEDFIFFAEDLNEPAYKIDRMFTQLFNISQFAERCRGVALGDFLGVDNKTWLEDYFKTIPCPAVGGFKITHCKEKITLPIGRAAVLRGLKLVIS